jgi:DNA-binding CsgD family transcriptional regulator
MRRNHLPCDRSRTIPAIREQAAKAATLASRRANGHASSGGPSAPQPIDHASLNLPFVQAGQGNTGFLLADRTLKPLYSNNAASCILCYPDGLRASVNSAMLQGRIRSILQVEHFIKGLAPISFRSGRRRYICRSFLVEPQDDGRLPVEVALVLERRPRVPIDFSEVSRYFHLSRREGETVELLIDGLTTKDVAQRMGISPNTVKQFVRLIMSKMGVTTRWGILGKLMVASPSR